MASYTNTEMNGNGIAGKEALPAGWKTFTYTNPTSSIDNNHHVAYFTIEGNSTANSNLSSTADLEGDFRNFTGGANIDSLVTSSTHWSLSISGGAGSFQYKADSTVGSGDYYVKSTGLFSMVTS
jgi:hypothetical protein